MNRRYGEKKLEKKKIETPMGLREKDVLCRKCFAEAKKTSEFRYRKPVNIKWQVILALIPLVEFFPHYRIKRLRDIGMYSSIILLIGSFVDPLMMSFDVIDLWSYGH